jgi:hypothetical protein
MVDGERSASACRTAGDDLRRPPVHRLRIATRTERTLPAVQAAENAVTRQALRRRSSPRRTREPEQDLVPLVVVEPVHQALPMVVPASS